MMVFSGKNQNPRTYPLMFPGDKSAPGYLVYNCRCTTIASFKDYGKDAQRRSIDCVSEDMTYQEREKRKEREMTRRRTAEDGHEIIDKPTYNRLTKDFVKSGGTIIRGEDAARHLNLVGAEASYITGSGVVFIRDDASVSAVLEEMFHAQQDKRGSFGDDITRKVLLLREIEAQEYLISVADKYKIPSGETEATIKALEYYKRELKNSEKE